MFGATRFVIAGAVLTLFGGLLLAGILTDQDDEVLPAAVTESPSLTPTEELLSAMVTEEVEPGVFRILNDGVRDLHARRPAVAMAIGQDGHVWLTRADGDGARGRLLRLGESDEQAYEAAGWASEYGMAVDTAGTFWGTHDPGLGEDISVTSFDGSTWTIHDWPDAWEPEEFGIEAAPDGTVLVVSGDRVARVRDGQWTFLPSWEEVARAEIISSGVAVTDDTVWLGCTRHIRTLEAGCEGLLRFDGTAWDVVAPLPERPDLYAGRLAVGPEGTLWVYLSDPDDDDVRFLARLSDGRWSVFSAEDGVPLLESEWEWGSDLSVDGDGTLWMATNMDWDAPETPVPGPLASPHGVASFDGSTWRQYLADVDVQQVEAIDGRVWALDSTDFGRGGLYVMTPEAVAAADEVAVEPGEPREAADTAVTPDLLPGVDLETEEIAPGVYRVLGDGVHDLSTDVRNVVVTADGSVLVEQYSVVGYGGPNTGPGDPRVRDARVVELGEHGISYEVGAGQLHLEQDGGDPHILVAGERSYHFDGEQWTLDSSPETTECDAVEPDGSCWWTRFNIYWNGLAMDMALDPTETPFIMRVAPDGQEQVFTRDDLGLAPGSDFGHRWLLLGDDGTVWTDYWSGDQDETPWGGLAAFDGATWTLVEAPEEFEFGPQGMAVAPDGSVWVAELADADVRVWTWDGDRWEKRGTFPLRGYLDGRIGFAFLADGRVRLDPLAALIDDGPYQFDLPASPGNLEPAQGSYAIAPDGSIWVVTLDMGVEEEGCTDYCQGASDGLYVITPEAMGDVGSSGSLARPRDRHSATLLPDGRVLVVSRNDAELWDPATESFGPAGDLDFDLWSHTAAPLPDGRVLVVGSTEWAMGPEAQAPEAWLWEPSTASFSAAPIPNRQGAHTATVLPDGQVLYIGGFYWDGEAAVAAPAEVWDPATETLIPAGELGRARVAHTSTLLPDGRVLVVGGERLGEHGGGGPELPSAELWDPVTASFNSTGSLADPRYNHTATLLSDGRVLVVGGRLDGKGKLEDGSDGCCVVHALTTAEVWDPATESFSTTGALADGRISHTATHLPDGRVLVAGGGGDDPSGVEIWDPTTGTFEPAAPLSEARARHTATLLPDGRLLVIGGWGEGRSTSVEMRSP